jgi:two-component system phosphate regulon response regulator OmpR
MSQPRSRQAHILIVDDDKRIRSLLSRFLMGEGYLVCDAANAAEADARMQELAFDLVVLDVMMPNEDGMTFARRLRSRSEPMRSIPILMLTALTETADRLEGLEAGVDDYLAKPFEPRELALRIMSILRRARPQEQNDAAPIVRFGAFTFDLARGELLRGENFIRLTLRESELLRVLAAHGGGIVSRQTLASRGSPPGKERASERSVDVEIARLRRKIEDDSSMPRHLQTVRGRGYRLMITPPHANLPGAFR